MTVEELCKIDNSFKVDSSKLNYIYIDDYDTYLKLNKQNDSCTYMGENVVLNDDIIQDLANRSNIYLSLPIINVSVSASNNVIDVTKYPELKHLYYIGINLDVDGVVISRDRKKIQIDDNVKKIEFTGDAIASKNYLYTSQVVVNIKEDKSLLDSIFDLFK